VTKRLIKRTDPVVEMAAIALANHGQVATQFITSSLEPVSLSRQPDIVFIPRAHPDRTYILELKTGLQHPADATILAGVRHVRAIRAANPAANFYFALALSEKPSVPMDALAKQSGIRVLAPAGNGEAIANAVVAWSQSEYVEGSLRVLRSEPSEIRASSRDTGVRVSADDYLRLLNSDDVINLDVVVTFAPPSGLLADRFEHFEVMGEICDGPEVIDGPRQVSVGDNLTIRLRPATRRDAFSMTL